MASILVSLLIYLAILVAAGGLAYGTVKLWADYGRLRDPFVGAFLLVPFFWIVYSALGIIAYRFWG